MRTPVFDSKTLFRFSDIFSYTKTKMYKGNFWTVKVLFAASFISLVFFVGALVLTFYGMGAIITNAIKLQVQLEKGTDQWSRFETLPEMTFKVWFWEVQNWYDVVNDDAMPDLKEVGPFVYNQLIVKQNFVMSTTQDVVSFERNTSMTFQPSLSNGSESDVLTLPNTALISILQLATPIERLALVGCLPRIFSEDINEIFINMTIRDALFEGILFAKQDPNIGVACNIIRNRIIEMSKNIRVIDRVDSDGNIISNDDADISDVYALKVSYFSFKVEKTDGEYMINRGRTDVSLLGEIIRWNGEQELDIWGTTMSVNNDTCKRIRGTDSTIYAPHVTKDRLIEVYNTDICRIVPITYFGEDTYKGINGYRFDTGAEIFTNSTENPENDCYCTKLSKDVLGNPSCFLDGVFDYMPCLGAPIVISYPHFLHAPAYADKVLGMDPDEEKHRITLLIEPNTGTPLEGKKRVQFNIVLRPEDFVTRIRNLRRVVTPVFWIEEGIDLQQKYVDMLHDQYFSKLQLATGFKYGLLALSAACFTVSLVFLIRKFCIKSNFKK